MKRLEVDLLETVELGTVTELRLQRIRDLREEVDLAQPSRLQLEEGMALPISAKGIPVSSWIAAND
jgi:hypothetical protein